MKTVQFFGISENPIRISPRTRDSRASLTSCGSSIRNAAEKEFSGKAVTMEIVGPGFNPRDRRLRATHSTFGIPHPPAVSVFKKPKKMSSTSQSTGKISMKLNENKYNMFNAGISKHFARILLN